MIKSVRRIWLVLLSCTAVNADQIVPPSLPFSAAVEHNGLVILSGMVAFEPGSSRLVRGSREQEFHQIMRNIGAVLAQHNVGFANVIKCTVLLADMGDWSAFNDVYRSYFKEPYPARTAMGVNGLPLGARAEVECWAARPVVARR